METVTQCYQWLLEQHADSQELQQSVFKKLANQVSSLDTSANIIIVSGTNGKGTTSYFLEQALLAMGYQVGAFISPHILSPCERIRLNGQAIDDEQFITYFYQVKQFYRQANEQINHFSFLALMMLLCFQDSNLDYWILEVGIGGRLDQMNVFEPTASIITTIGLDHIGLLGNTREEIAFDKAHVYRSGKPAICGDVNPPATLTDYANKIGAKLLCQGREFSYQLNDGSWRWHMGKYSRNDLPPSNLPTQNIATAMAALANLPIDFSSFLDSKILANLLANIVVPGRFERVSQHPDIYLDVAHNELACQYLAKRLQQLPKVKKVIAVVGIAPRKSIADCLSAMSIVVDEWYYADLPNEGASFSQQAKQWFDANQLATYSHDCHDLIDATNLAIAQAGNHDRIIIFGSFVTVEVVTQHVDKI